MTITTTPPPITLKEKLIFGSGDIFIGGSQVIMAFYYLRFLTDVVQISPALAGTAQPPPPICRPEATATQELGVYAMSILLCETVAVSADH